MTKIMKIDGMLPIEEFAERMGMSRRAVYQMRHQGVGPAYYRIANRIYYKEADIEAWLETLRVEQGQYRRERKGGKGVGEEAAQSA